MIKRLKFKKLLNEYKSCKFELEMIREILKDGHLEFEVFYRRWCADNGVDIDKLNKSNSKNVQVIFEKQEKGLMKLEEPTQRNTDKHKKVFREIARKIHPDKLETSDPRFWEYTNAFKDANRAIEKQKWGDLFEVVEKYDIWLTDYDEACEDIQKSIDETKELIEAEKKTYSWSLHICGDNNTCKEKVVKNFLHHLFGWKS
tara:strand:- start:511 stop:1113 length:603 start_codon:yes stop_codon:yes gene_type:complete